MGLRYCCDNCGGDAEKSIEFEFKKFKFNLNMSDTTMVCIQCLIHALTLKDSNERTEKQA